MATTSRSFSNCLLWNSLALGNSSMDQGGVESLKSCLWSEPLKIYAHLQFWLQLSVKADLLKLPEFKVCILEVCYVTVLLTELCTIKCIWWEADGYYKYDIYVLCRLSCAGKVKSPGRYRVGERAQLLRPCMLLAILQLSDFVHTCSLHVVCIHSIVVTSLDSEFRHL